MVDLRIGSFRLRHDGIQWTVTTTVTGKSAREERDSDPSYYTRLSHALDEVLDGGIGAEDAPDVRALLQAVQAHSQAVQDAAADADRQLLAARAGV